MKCKRIEEEPHQFICHFCDAFWWDNGKDWRPGPCPERRKTNYGTIKMTIENRVTLLEKILKELSLNPWVDDATRRVIKPYLTELSHGTTKESKDKD